MRGQNLFLCETQISFPAGGRLSLLQKDGEIFLVVSEHLRDVAGAPAHSVVLPACPFCCRNHSRRELGSSPSYSGSPHRQFNLGIKLT